MSKNMRTAELWGTFEVGRWGNNLNGDRLWSVEYDNDPYRTLRMNAEDAPEWFNTGINAKDLVAELLKEEGDDLELYFADAKKKVRVIDRVQEAHLSERCRLDPVFFVEHFKELHWDGLYQMLGGCAGREGPVHEPYMCINPQCLYVRFVNGRHSSIIKCTSCDKMTSVNTAVLIEHGAPSGPVMMLADMDYLSLKRALDVESRLSMLSRDNKHVSMQLYDYRPAYRVSKDMPGIKISGDHFIKGRANRDVLIELRVSEWPGDDEYPTDIQEDPAYHDLMISTVRVHQDGIDRFFELIEEPDKFLDPTRADKFREEYIDTRWDEEFAVFVRKLIDDDILIVDSSGVNETLTTLYHMAQRKAEKRTVIKKNGKIVFPTKEVLENINPFMMARAFELTEHAQYTDPAQVFRMDGGAA